MAVKTVQYVFNGQTYDLTFDASTGEYKATVPAPQKSSYSQSGHKYGGSVVATDDAGNSTTSNNGRSNMQVIIDFGETRHIMLEVVSIKNDEFVISSASYVLRNEQTGKDETAGSCNIIAHLIDTVIEPKEKGEYQLIVTYKIADETLIDAVKVVVM